MIRVLDHHVQDEDAPERRAADAAVELDAARAELAEAERQQRNGAPARFRSPSSAL